MTELLDPAMPEKYTRRVARVLLVDDDPIQNEIGRIMLERLGCVVETASSGETALERCKRQAFDLILMDQSVPVIGGVGTTAAIRALPPPSCDATIIGTGSTRGDGACEEAGMNDYLAKPLTVSALRRVLMAWSTGKYKEEGST